MLHHAIIVDNSKQRTVDLSAALAALGQAQGREWEIERVGLEHPAQAFASIVAKLDQWSAVTVLSLDVVYDGSEHRYAGIDKIYAGLAAKYGPEKRWRRLFFCTILKYYATTRPDDYKEFQRKLKVHVHEPYDLIGPALELKFREEFAARANEVAAEWEAQLG